MKRKLVIRGCLYVLVLGILLFWRWSRLDGTVSIGLGGYETVRGRIFARMYVTNHTPFHLCMPWGWVLEQDAPEGVRLAGGEPHADKLLGIEAPTPPSSTWVITPGRTASRLVVPPLGPYPWRVWTPIWCATKRDRIVARDYSPPSLVQQPVNALCYRLRALFHRRLPSGYDASLDEQPKFKVSAVSTLGRGSSGV